jgi:hypothetical protein
MPEHRTEPEHSNFNLSNILLPSSNGSERSWALHSVLLAAAACIFSTPQFMNRTRGCSFVMCSKEAVMIRSTPCRSSERWTGLTIDGVIGAEVSILTSWDLSVQVAEALGPNRVLPDAKAPTVVGAAAAINSGLVLLHGQEAATSSRSLTKIGDRKSLPQF